MNNPPPLDSEMQKKLGTRFFQMIEEEFSSITAGEVVQSLVNMYVNTVCLFGDTDTEKKIKLGKQLIEEGFERYKRIKKEDGSEVECHWGNEPIEEDLHFGPSPGDG